MSTGAKRHVHTYERSPWNKKIYRCADPECSHFVNKKMILGKVSMCKCGNKFILTPYDLLLKNPLCTNCSARKRKKLSVDNKIMQSILNSDVTREDERIT